MKCEEIKLLLQSNIVHLEQEKLQLLLKSHKPEEIKLLLQSQLLLMLCAATLKLQEIKMFSQVALTLIATSILMLEQLLKRLVILLTFQ